MGAGRKEENAGIALSLLACGMRDIPSYTSANIYDLFASILSGHTRVSTLQLKAAEDTRGIRQRSQDVWQTVGHRLD